MNAARLAVYEARKTKENSAQMLAKKRLDIPLGPFVLTAALNSMAHIIKNERNKENRPSE